MSGRELKGAELKDSMKNKGTDNATTVRLGEELAYSDVYTPSFLEPIPRSISRASNFSDALPFVGKDVWTCYELSWVNKKGVPQVAIAEFIFDAMSENIIESKSFKYYLNSYNQTVFDSLEDVRLCLESDLSRVSRGDVLVSVRSLSSEPSFAQIDGVCLDNLDCELSSYRADASLLQLVDGGVYVNDSQVYSHLLKSNCPVTGQPDWATVWIEYSGLQISNASLLAYIVSYRCHQDFHETCVERIFTDLMKRCSPEKLSVYARYTRRGGLDINPFRSNCSREIPFGRLPRQ